MFDVTDLDPPVWGDKETGTKFTVAALDKWSDALDTYSGKSEKSTAKVEKVLNTIRETNPNAVSLTDETMNEVRSLILHAVLSDPETTFLLFDELNEVKKAIGSWRSDVNVEVTSDEDDDDRDLLAEYESLDKGRTMIEGTFNAFGLDVLSLPEKYRAKKMERVNGKNVPVVPEQWMLKFPGKLVSPLSENTAGSNGKTATSMTYTWSLLTNDGEVNIGKASFPFLARTCSTPQVIIGTDDLLTSIKAKYGDSFAGNDEIEVRTPRGTLTGTKVKK